MFTRGARRWSEVLKVFFASLRRGSYVDPESGTYIDRRSVAFARNIIWGWSVLVLFIMAVVPPETPADADAGVLIALFVTALIVRGFFLRVEVREDEVLVAALIWTFRVPRAKGPMFAVRSDWRARAPLTRYDLVPMIALVAGRKEYRIVAMHNPRLKAFALVDELNGRLGLLPSIEDVADLSPSTNDSVAPFGPEPVYPLVCVSSA